MTDRADGMGAGGPSIRPDDLVASAVVFVVFVGVWAAVAAFTSVPPYLLPGPADIAGRLTGNPELYATSALTTLGRILYGGGVGILGGFLVAVAVVAVRPLRSALMPYFVAVRVVPKVAVAPPLVITLGTGWTTAVVFIALIAFFPICLGTIAGLDRIDRRYIDLLRSVDAGPASAIAVRLRFALPEVISGLKQSVTLAVVGAIVAEWIVVDGGLGSLILVASENLLADVMIAALVVLLLEGMTLYGLVVALERQLLWYRIPG